MTSSDDPASPPADIRSALECARRAAGGGSARDASAWIAHLLELPRASVLAHPERTLSGETGRRFLAGMARLAAGEPLAYLTGEREFFGLQFHVSPDVLVPRPETELLVERALAWLKNRERRSPRAAEAGTGSGCIAAALALGAPDLRLAATDISRGALAVAARNLLRHGVADRVALARADLLAPLRGPFDLICANPPYIPAGVLDTLPVARFEPRPALDGGADGLAVIRRLLPQCAARLAPGGAVMVEIEASQREAAARLAGAAFPGARVDVEQDLAGLDRLLVIELE